MKCTCPTSARNNPKCPVHGKKKGVAEGSLAEGQYEMMLRNGQVKKFIAKDDAMWNSINIFQQKQKAC